MVKLSVIISAYNERANVHPLLDKLFSSLKDIDFEIVYVDDGSIDGTADEVESIKDDRIISIRLKKNYGQSSALAAGIDYAKGEYIAMMDADLQNDPDDLPLMLDLAEKEGWDVISGIRAKRKDGLFLRKIPSKIANRIIRVTTKLKIEDYGCTLRIMKSDIAKNLGLYGESHRFIPILAHLQGASILQVYVKHHPRTNGKSKYGINRTPKVMADLLLMLFQKKYMQRPMHLFGGIGLFLTMAGIMINLYLLLVKISGSDIWGKPLLLLGILTLLSGLQFITVGILSEIQMRTYYESQNKKPYNIKSITRNKNENSFIHKSNIQVVSDHVDHLFGN